jgi:hypothetical protein
MIGVVRRNGARPWLGVFAVALLAAGGGQVSIPRSSVEQPGDTGVRVHTNIEIFIPNQKAPGRSPNQTPQAPRTTGKKDSTQPQ